MRGPGQIFGEPGYVSADITVILPSSYSGFGVAGYVRDASQTYEFQAKLRESDFQRPRSDISQPPFKAGVGDNVSRRINLSIYYKGDNYPPDFEQYEFLLFQITFGGILAKTFILMVESFKQVGDVERAVEYAVSGETDGYFDLAGY